MVEIPDTSFSEIQEQCLATHKVGGFYGQHKWELVLIHVNGERRTEISEATARFNTLDHIGVLAFWTSERELTDYLGKREKNAEWVKKYARPNDPPYSPQVLAASAVCAVNFNLENIQSIIKNQEEQMLAKFGVYPTEPMMVQLQDSSGFFRVFLRIIWQS